MGKKAHGKKTRKDKRTESFTEQYGMTPQEFLDNLQTLPNNVRTKANIREAKTLA